MKLLWIFTTLFFGFIINSCDSGDERRGSAVLASTGVDACRGCDNPGGVGHQCASLVCAGRTGRDAPGSCLDTAERDALRGLSIQNSLSL